MRLFRFSSWMLLWPIAIVLFLYPINNEITRSSVLLSFLGLWMGCLYFGWNKRWLRVPFLSLTVLAIAFLVFPSRNYDHDKLRQNYVGHLRSYEGTRYVWGGENRLGVDCSGLVRTALIKASFQQGIVTANPGLVRFSLSLWWHDSTAKALGEEYRNQTKHVLNAKSINELGQNKIIPGDIAVTDSGVHVLASLGNDEWIEADPHFTKVVIVKVPAPKNPWFQEPVHIMRWTELGVHLDTVLVWSSAFRRFGRNPVICPVNAELQTIATIPLRTVSRCAPELESK